MFLIAFGPSREFELNLVFFKESLVKFDENLIFLTLEAVTRLEISQETRKHDSDCGICICNLCALRTLFHHPLIILHALHTLFQSTNHPT